MVKMCQKMCIYMYTYIYNVCGQCHCGSWIQVLDPSRLDLVKKPSTASLFRAFPWNMSGILYILQVHK